jgi:galactoside O-acetyltransferase
MVEARHNDGWEAVFSPGEQVPEDLLRARLRHCGAGVKVYAGARLVGAERIALGDRSQIDEGVRVFAGEGVEIGRHVHLAFGASISGGGRCEIGDFASVAAGVRLITGSDLADGSGLTNPTVPATLRAVRRDRVRIGAHAVLFTGVIVLPGVSIGEGAVVSAGAVVHRDLKPWAIYAGQPLVQIGVRPKETILRRARELLAGAAGATETD